MPTNRLKTRSFPGFFLILVISVISLFILYQFAATQAKIALISRLSQYTSHNVSIKNLAFRLPATILITGLEVGERKDQKYFSIGQASISMAPFASLLKRQPVFSRIQIIEPGLFYEIEEPKKASPAKSARAKFFPAAQRIEITNGSIEFIDRRLPGRKLTLALSDLNVIINLKGRNRAGAVIEFSGQADLLFGAHSPKGRIIINGWTDLYSRLTRARVEIKNLDGVYLYPYYSEWVHLEKARIKKAQLDFSADITGQGSEFDAACTLELVQSEFEPLAQGQNPEQPQKLAMLVIEVLKALDKGRVFVDFNLKFDADDPYLDMKPLGAAFSEKIKNGFAIKPAEVKDAMKLPENVVKKTLETLGGITKTVLSQTVDLGQQLQQSVQDTFIRVAPKNEK
jgi:hypothetical protein